MYKYLLAGLLVLPNISYASVKINEIAWMGTKNSSTDEWIELYNDGNEDISLSGYSIVSIDDKLKINLKGVIKSNSFYLIERTDDNSVPDILADLIASFGSGLSNEGETLRLLGSNGSVIDEVVSGSNWKSIGGNSETKDTAQLSNGSWITAVATPKAINKGSSFASEHVDAVDSSSESVSNSPSFESNVSSNKNKRDYYKIVVKNDGLVVKDIPEKFTGKVFGFTDEELRDADIKWNFGDGTIASGKEVTHTYNFEGIYPLVAFVKYNDVYSEVRIKIDVKQDNLKIVESKSGDFGYIKIISSVDTDLSNYYLRDGDAVFNFPKGSQLFAKTPTIFANSITGIVKHHSLAIHNKNGKIVSVFGNGDYAPKTQYFSNNARLDNKNSKESLANNSTSSNLLLANVNSSKRIPTWIYLAVSGFFVLATAIIVIFSKVFNKNREIEEEAKKYTLVEIDSNLE